MLACYKHITPNMQHLLGLQISLQTHKVLDTATEKETPCMPRSQLAHFLTIITDIKIEEFHRNFAPLLLCLCHMFLYVSGKHSPEIYCFVCYVNNAPSAWEDFSPTNT